ncbi:MAG: ABC transporter permease [Clostridiales bacterium]|nr:ABC transporter permease [Clostridiales bacterium]MDY2833730.1 ABC transporter permease [Candidatus Aphodomonas sp.]
MAAEKKVLASRRYAKRSQSAEIWHRLRKNKGAMLGLAIMIAIILIAIGSNIFLDYDTDVIGQNVAERLQHPSLKHPMGTDATGRDMMYRIFYGTRYSLSIGIASVLIALVIGVTLGVIAGYYGGRVSEIIMRLSDAIAAIPSILMAIAIVSALGQSMFNLMLAVGVTSVPQFVRITHAATLTVRNQEYVEASRCLGLRQWQIILFHVLPNCLSPIIVQTTLRVASAIISASSLSFLGLGVPAPMPEWGGLLSAGRKYIRTHSYLTLFPGLAIMITVLALNLLGDGLRDALDPKLKGKK